jgi:predicted transcriptional regulator of viral defense system
MPSTRDLLAAGFTHNELARQARRGELVRLRRGSYALPAEVGTEPETRHRQLVEATVPLLAAGTVVSHLSAAVLHELPVWGDQLGRVQVTRSAAAHGKRRGNVHVHTAALTADEVTTLQGLSVTTLARTVVDLGRTVPPQQAVAAGDAALRAGLSGTELDAVLALAQRRPHVAAARRVVNLLDARSESAGESASRVVLHELGIPPSSLQHEVLDASGRLIGRTDFAWEQYRTLGEFDGRIKYGRLLRPGETAADVVYREKRREDALRDQGWQVVRWSWADLLQPHLLADRLHRAFRRGTR